MPKINTEILNELTKRTEEITPHLDETLEKLRIGRGDADHSARVLLMGQVTGEVLQMTRLLDDFSKNYEERNLVLDSSSRENSDEATRNMQLTSLLSILFLWSFGLPIAFSLSKKLQLVISGVEE